MIWIVLFLSFLFAGCDTVKDVFVEKDLLERPESKRCGECHRLIYNQWMRSRHSKSWTSEDYRKKTESYRKVKCFNCHIPYQVDTLKEPDFRKEKREDGIGCVSCHFKDETGSIHGGYNVFSPPHPSRKDPDYKKSDFCGGCHKKSYQQWKISGSKKSCQECHMPPKKEYLIQKFPFKYFHLKKDLHDHSFLVPVPDEKYFELKLNIGKDTVTLYIKNIRIPHSVPTADNGKPKYYIRGEFFKNGRHIHSENYLITSKDPIDYMKTRSVDFYIFEDFSHFKVTIERKLSWKKKKEKILELIFRKEDILFSQ